MRLRFVGVLLCFLVLAFVHHCLWVVGVGAFWVGHRVYSSRHTVGFTFNTVLASAIVVVVACASGLGIVLWVWVCVVGCL